MNYRFLDLGKLLIFFIISTQTTAFAKGIAEAKWVKDNSENKFVDKGIDIFIAPKYEHKSGIIPVKGVFKTDQNMGEILAALQNEKYTSEWLSFVSKSKTLEKSNSHAVLYRRFQKIWPFKARDIVFKTKTEFNHSAKSLTFRSQSVKHPLAPSVQDGDHRANMIEAVLVVSGKSKYDSTVVFHSHMDYGGWIPSALQKKKQMERMADYLYSLKSFVEKKNIPLNRDLRGLNIILFTERD